MYLGEALLDVETTPESNELRRRLVRARVVAGLAVELVRGLHARECRGVTLVRVRGRRRGRARLLAILKGVAFSWIA